MRSRWGVAWLFFLIVLVGFGALASCGARTGLFTEQALQVDAGPDVMTFPRDSSIPDDTTMVEDDAAPFIDVPPIDVRPLPDVFINDCPDAGATLIYVVTQNNELLSFYPPTALFKPIGMLACPAPATFQPFSMAVDRQGTAYVLFADATRTTGMIFQVSTLTAACIPTSYIGGQSMFNTFGMGFVGNSDGMTDTLYVASDESDGGPGRLATIDVNNFQLGVVGAFQPQTVDNAELTGTGDGRLFAFYSIDTMTSSAVAQIDPMTATVIANNNFDNLPQAFGWAFGFWGGSFYLFTGSGGTPQMPTSKVTRFNPADGTLTEVAGFSDLIVGAGVSTCAPMQ